MSRQGHTGSRCREDRRLARWIEALRCIPDELRVFDLDERRAERLYGLSTALVDELAQLGLPHETRDDRRWIASPDAHFLGLRLGVATVALRVLAENAASIDRLGSLAQCTLEITAVVRDVDEPVDVLRPTGETITVAPLQRTVRTSFRVVTTGAWPDVGREIADLCAGAAALDFCFLPAALQHDTSFPRRHGLGDCWSACYALLEACDARGFPARTAYGLLLSSPYPTPHNWLEVQVADRWVPLDPLTLSLLWRFGGLSRERWPAHRSLGPALLRLAGREVSLATTASGPIQPTFLARVVD